MDRFDALFDLSPIAQEEYDVLGRLVRMNRASMDLFGIDDARELSKMNLFSNPHLPPGFAERLAAGQRVEWDLEYSFGKVKFVTSRQGVIYLHATIFPIPGEDGTPTGYLLQTFDITEQTRSSRALRESADLHTALIENMDDGWILFDHAMKVVEYMDTSSGLFGRQAQEMLGKRLADLLLNLPPTERADLEASFQAILARGKPLRMRSQVFMPPGQRRSARVVVDVSAFRVMLGGEPHVACFVSDVTSNRKLEDQLNQAQKMESIGRLASAVAHDFNNLLAGILGNASLIEMQPDDTEGVRASASEIKEAAKRAADLTSSLLGLSRRKPPRREPTSLASVVRNVTGLFEKTTASTVRLDVDVPDDLPPITADPSQMESVVMNLLVNAVDAMPQGGEVRISARPVDVDRWRPGTNPAVGTGKWVLLRVSDSGTGMDAETSARAFEPFFTTKPPGKGTGLGLYSVYGIVQNHDGQITLTSEPGKGTTFDLYFPVQPLASAHRKQASIGEPLEGHGTILVVDDERIVRQTLATMLSRLGYRTLTAESGEQALEILASTVQPVDLVLLDIVMQGIDGAETFRRIRALDHPPHVLMMSGHAGKTDVDKLIKDGARGFLAKPFTLRGLSRKVRLALAG